MGTGLLQLIGQLSQFPGMGCIVAHHVLHQSQQLVHLGMLAGSAAAAAAAAVVVVVMMVVVMIVVMMIMVMMMVMMLVVMAVLVAMLVVVIVVMHKDAPSVFSYIISAGTAHVKTFIFPETSPTRACGAAKFGV